MKSAPDVLDQVFLEMRAKLLEVGASLDRIHRSDRAADAAKDPRLGQICEGIAILNSGGFDRAERIQMLFSDAYDSNWMKK
ncbi:MAG: hypothetical protein HZA46_10415 [Planctomycetales bacterium]|nr:hypothetical protein [Planctomycetales bacterium]